MEKGIGKEKKVSKRRYGRPLGIMKGHFSVGKKQAEAPTYRSVPRSKAYMLHPDMFSGHSKEHEALIPSLLYSVRMRSLKQHSTQIRYKKDYEDMYDPDPSRKLAMLRNARLGRETRRAKQDQTIFTTLSDNKPHQRRSDSFSLSGLKRTRLDLSDCVIDRVSTAFESEKFTTSVISSDLRGILGEVNRVLSTVTNAANIDHDSRLGRRKDKGKSFLCADSRAKARVRRVSNLGELRIEEL